MARADRGIRASSRVGAPVPLFTNPAHVTTPLRARLTGYRTPERSSLLRRSGGAVRPARLSFFGYTPRVRHFLRFIVKRGYAVSKMLVNFCSTWYAGGLQEWVYTWLSWALMGLQFGLVVG